VLTCIAVPPKTINTPHTAAKYIELFCESENPSRFLYKNIINVELYSVIKLDFSSCILIQKIDIKQLVIIERCKCGSNMFYMNIVETRKIDKY
jgi:hypothetical protein